MGLFLRNGHKHSQHGCVYISIFTQGDWKSQPPIHYAHKGRKGKVVLCRM